MATITIEIPDEIASQYASLEEMRRTMYEDFVIEQRQQGVFSLGEAAKLLNISYVEFFMLLGKKGLSFINATPAELEERSQHVQRIMERTDISNPIRGSWSSLPVIRFIFPNERKRLIPRVSFRAETHLGRTDETRGEKDAEKEGIEFSLYQNITRSWLQPA